MSGPRWAVPPAGTLWAYPPDDSVVPGHPRRQTGWRLHSDVFPHWFEGRRLTRRDAGRQTYDDDDDDDGSAELLRLGNPESTSADQLNPIVSRWGLQVLNAAGFINGRTPDQADRASAPRGTLRHRHQDHPIHPVLRRGMWKDLSAGDWDLIQPSLHLATAILDTPEMLRFFGAYWQPYRAGYDQRVSMWIKVVSSPQTLDAQQLQHLYLTIAMMRHFTSFKFVDPQDMDGVLGRTGPVPGDGFIAGRTTRSEILISSSYLAALRLHRHPTIADEVLNEYQDKHGVERDRRIHIDAASSSLRVRLELATTILHEFSHAVRFASDEMGPGTNHGPGRTPGDGEPYFPGDRVAEVGTALEKFVFGGGIGFLGHTYGVQEDGLHAPYGLVLEPNPNFHVPGGLEDPPDEVTCFPVHSGWVSALFEREFWEQRVKREGGQWIRCPLFREWAVTTRLSV